jgi:hypothetical protein
MDHLFFKPNLSSIRFTVPSAVALLNYRMCGTLSRIFSQTGISRGVSTNCISLISLAGSAKLQWTGRGRGRAAPRFACQ